MMISVAMATYNGEIYIKQQIESILKQLNDDDELIISDDFSNDKTLEIIYSYKSPYIKLYKNTFKKGTIGNFENAINSCVGDIIVFSDQDDIWNQDKIKIIRYYFEETNCDVLVNNAVIINDSGKQIANSLYEYRHSGTGIFKNIFKNTYVGCCMAFRSTFKPIILPFPNNIPMHDVWIGILGEMFGKVRFIEDKLTYYRRHGNNATDFKKANLRKIMIWRINLVINLFKRYLIISFIKKGGELNS